MSKSERRQLKKERKHEERQASRRAGRTKRVLGWFAGIALLVLVIYAGVAISRRADATRPGEEISYQGKQHISAGEDHVAYNSNPPTSGPHYGSPADWGVYGYELVDENVLHSLEHGGIWISYTGIDEETKGKLEAIGRRYSGRTVVSPRAANDAPIAIASWTRLLKLHAFDEEQILAFIKQNTNKSPEPLAR